VSTITYERRYTNILQGLGHRTTCGVQPWLAPQCGYPRRRGGW